MVDYSVSLVNCFFWIDVTVVKIYPAMLSVYLVPKFNNRKMCQTGLILKWFMIGNINDRNQA